MSLVAGCDSLIFDLRDNLGGNPAMVAFISSYLFQEPVHLDDIFERRTNVSVESWTLPYVPGRKFIGSPVFVLTSPRTFSGAEEFAYNLQMLKRAVIVGEASGGGAHPAVPLRIGAHFQVVVPVARYINPVSRTNWEGRGVEPDIRAREDVAAQAAYRAALEGVIQTMTPSKQRDAVGRQIDALTKVIGATSSSH
jgi:C-terminal processing protease CtpA/Prc